MPSPRTRRLIWAALGGASLLALVGTLVFGLFGGSDAAPPEAGPAPQFVEEAAAAGLLHVYDGEFTFFVGGGVAVFDCDADRRPDLYLAGGANPAALYRNESGVGGELRFAAAGGPATDLTEVTGAYPVDVDSDGVVDLAVLRLGENVLLRGLGDCRFERANEAWAFDGGDAWTAAFSAIWEGDAALPTLAFGNYLDLDASGRPLGQCADHVLARPADGVGYPQPTRLAPGWCTLSILFSDWDRSGRADLRMTNDRHYYRDGEDQLWRIAAGEKPSLYGRDDGWKQLQIWGMGIASQDVTGDGRPEVFITSQGDNKLQSLDGEDGPSYADIAFGRGVTAHRPHIGDETLPSTAWHPEFQDVNNDGYVDLYISKGNVEAMTEYAAADPSNLLLGRPDGSFVEAAATAGLVNVERSRGAALADFNLDGKLDLIEVNRRENVTLWRSVERTGSWVAVALEQEGVNRFGVGSWVEVRVDGRTVSREVTVGGGHAGGQLGWLHFGLGAADAAEVRVQWPDGDTGPWLDVAADSFAIIERGADEARVWEP